MQIPPFVFGSNSIVFMIKTVNGIYIFPNKYQMISKRKLQNKTKKNFHLTEHTGLCRCIHSESHRWTPLWVLFQSRSVWYWLSIWREFVDGTNLEGDKESPSQLYLLFTCLSLRSTSTLFMQVTDRVACVVNFASNLTTFGFGSSAETCYLSVIFFTVARIVLKETFAQNDGTPKWQKNHNKYINNTFLTSYPSIETKFKAWLPLNR